MKLSMWILADWLKEYKPILMIKEGEPVLRGVRLFSAELIFEKQNVYIGPASEFVDGYKDEVICVSGNDMIILETNDMDLVLNRVFEAFDFYNKWTDGLIEDIYAGCTLQHVVDVSTEVLDDPLIVFDYSYIVLALSSKFPRGSLDKEWDYLLDYKSNHIETLAILNSFLHKSRKIKTVQHVFFEEIGIPCMNRNIFDGNINKGLLLVVQNKHEITRGRMHITETLGTLVERWIVFNKEKTERKDEAGLLLNLLEGRPVIQEEIQQQLMSYGWQQEDSKILLKITTTQHYEENSGPFMILLENNFADCFILEYEKSIIMVVNLNFLPMERLKEVLVPILKRSKYYAGTSYDFSEIQGLKKSYEQASIALTYSSKKMGEIYWCGDYALEYMFRVIRTSVSRNMIHPVLTVLRDYDQEKGTDYYNTLHQYLDNERSIKKTARAMNLHRNTLLYRLEKIKEIVDVDLDDSETRAYLLISLKINI